MGEVRFVVSGEIHHKMKSAPKILKESCRYCEGAFKGNLNKTCLCMDVEVKRASVQREVPGALETHEKKTKKKNSPRLQ